MKAERDILVVDDEQVITQAVVRVCGAEGLSVDTAESAETGLSKIARTNYRLIISDVMMADIDGYAFLIELLRRRVSTPVILTTGMSTMENAVRSLNSGAIDFIPKPFTADELLAAVHRGLQYARLLAAAATAQRSAHPDTLAWVPPPPQYHRLGYASWLSTEHDGTATMGVTDLFLKTVESPSGLTLGAPGDEVVQGSNCATIASADGLAHTVLCPVTGRIVEVNTALLTTPTVLERDPYFEGWLYCVLPSELQYDLHHLTACSSDRM